MDREVRTPEVHVGLLGSFHVTVDGCWIGELTENRRAAELVKLLALAPQHRRHREEVVEVLWDHLEPDAALANLHKAASYARKALGSKEAVVLRGGWVHLWPAANLSTDVEVFDRQARRAIESGDLQLCAKAAECYGAGLLPEDLYAEWAAEPRERLRHRYLDLLRRANRWEDLVRLEPGDEQAHREIIRDLLRQDRRHAALRQWQQLRASLSELGLRPDRESLALWRELVDATPVLAPVRYAPPPMVGRDLELGRARRALEQAGSGRGGTLLVTGDIGIGKTRFCEALLGRAGQLGWTTLRGSPSQIDGAAPWAPIVEAFDRVLRERPDLAEALSEPAREGLARLFGRSAPSPSGAEVRGRQPILLAASQLLANAAMERGVVFWIDDLHLVDEATIQLVHYVARAARYGRMLIVLAYQRDMLSTTASRLCANLLAGEGATEIELAPLSPADSASIVRTVAGSELPDATLSAIYRMAEGNPFFTEELASAIGPDGSLSLPRRLCEIVETRLGELEPTLRSALQRVAVAGVRFSADELAAFAGLNQTELFDLLDAALQVGVVIETPGGYRFRNAILRETLLASLPAHRRRATHRCAAEALVKAGAAPGRIAHHLLGAEAGTEAVPWLERAALDAAAAGAVAEARAFVERALEHAPRRPSLLELRANCLFAAGERTSLAAFTDAIDAARGKRRRRLRIRQARAAVVLGDLTTATRALDGLVAATPAERVDLLVARGFAATASGDLRVAERCAEQARRIAIDEGLAAELTSAATLRALVAHSRGEWQHQIELDLLDTSKLPQLAASVHDGHLCVVEHYLYGDRPYGELIDFAVRLRETAKRSGAGRGEAFATVILGEAELLTGNLDAAEEHLRQGAELHRRVGSSAGQSLALQRRAEAVLLGGRAGEARELLAQALELARHSTLLGRHLLPRIYGTMVNAADPPDAIHIVDEAESAIVGPTEVCRMCTMTFAVPAVVACVHADQLDRAEHYLGLAKDIAQPIWLGGAWHAAIAEAEASLAAAVGRPDRAARLLQTAGELFAAAGQPHDARRCQAGVGGQWRDGGGTAGPGLTASWSCVSPAAAVPQLS
ncbi:ATP-binding protein [Pseudonocardia hispaniensis]|uniref:ATP-binding protein n=1 Tax=Pseudonocardia hispaniensis TaxID=904933 RepID=A0ABW1J7L4_9PSEU